MDIWITLFPKLADVCLTFEWPCLKQIFTEEEFVLRVLLCV